MKWLLTLLVLVLPLPSFATTLTVFPDPGSPGVTTFDGTATNDNGGSDQSFATMIGATGNASAGATANQLLYLTGGGTTDNFRSLNRAEFLFDTSTIGSSMIISSADLDVDGITTTFTQLGSPDIDIGKAAPASNTTIANADYSAMNADNTVYATIANASWVTSAYNDFSLGATGQANVNKIGVSKFSMRLSWDILGSFTGTWATFANKSGFAFESADAAGTGLDPKLIIVYAPPPQVSSITTLTGGNTTLKGGTMIIK